MGCSINKTIKEYVFKYTFWQKVWQKRQTLIKQRPHAVFSKSAAKLQTLIE
jgi:hypothetical protein